MRETDVHFIRMLEQAVTRAYESNQRYNRQSSKTFDVKRFNIEMSKHFYIYNLCKQLIFLYFLQIPQFYTQPGEHMVHFKFILKITLIYLKLENFELKVYK